MVVVDASALAAIAFDDAGAVEMVVRLKGESLHAPSLFELEMVNAAISRCRRDPERAGRFIEGLATVLGMPIAIHAVAPLGVLSVALRQKLTAYDAAYLWLSGELGAPLVTLDKQLAAAAKKHL